MPGQHAAVLSPRYQATPYWWGPPRPADEAGAARLGDPLPGDPLPGEAQTGDAQTGDAQTGRALPGDADVLIVGAGYTGLGAALELARRGRHPVVVDRDGVASGASSRNGGMVHPGGKHALDQLLAMPDGRALWDVTTAAFDGVEELVAELGIDCGWHRSGHLELAHHPRAVARLRAEEAAYRAIGERAWFVEPDALGEEIGTHAYHGGLVVERSGNLHPARFAAGLASAAQAAGAVLVPHTTVRHVERTSAGFAVDTDRGSLRARDVMIATNGYTDSLVPWLGRRILPIGSFIIATEPVDPALAASVSPRGRMFFDTKNFLSYWRLSPDGSRILFGGRTSFAPTTVERARDSLYSAMVRVHPQLAGTAVEFAWGGNVALTVDRMPHLGRHPGSGVVYSMGYCGTGVAMATHCGRALGRWLAGDGELPAYERLRWRSVPPPARVSWLLPVAGWWYQARDRLGV
jgi:glycine/D-amino acid oxidase-like deaminating enzyme